MPAFVSDTFTDTTGVLLQDHTGEIGASWTKHPGYTGDATIDTNVLYGAGIAVFDQYYASGVPDGADYYVQASLVFKTSVASAQWYITGRTDHTVAAGQDTYYYISYLQNNAVWSLGKSVAGTATELGSFAQADGADHVARLFMSGTTIQESIDDALQVSVVDSAISAAGRVGLGLLNVTGSPLVDYSLDTFSAVSPGVPLLNVGGIYQPFQLWLEEDLLE